MPIRHYGEYEGGNYTVFDSKEKLATVRSVSSISRPLARSSSMFIFTFSCACLSFSESSGAASASVVVVLSCTGQAPDLIICDNATAAYSYAANGSFEMLQPYLDKVDLNVDNFFPGCKDVIYYKDEPYLIPQDTNVMLLYYNPDMVTEAGLDPETEYHYRAN